MILLKAEGAMDFMKKTPVAVCCRAWAVSTLHRAVPSSSPLPFVQQHELRGSRESEKPGGAGSLKIRVAQSGLF